MLHPVLVGWEGVRVAGRGTGGMAAAAAVVVVGGVVVVVLNCRKLVVVVAGVDRSRCRVGVDSTRGWVHLRTKLTKLAQFQPSCMFDWLHVRTD